MSRSEERPCAVVRAHARSALSRARLPLPGDSDTTALSRRPLKRRIIGSTAHLRRLPDTWSA